jgi:cation diffusion facilitator family transporter
MVVNTFLVAGKMAAGIVGHSHALVADAVESLADILSSLVVWRGLVVAAEPADEDHPYGHGKAEPIAGAVVATMLLLAAGWITVSAVREIVRPHTTPAPFTLVVLLAVVAVKEGLYRFVLREAASVKSSVVHTDAWHHRSDAITSLAAAVGISAALIGGPGYEMADDVAAVLAAGIIAWNGWRLLRPALDELMDASPASEFVNEIRRIASSSDGVVFVEKCLVRKTGYHYFVDMHVEVDPRMTVQHAHEIAHGVKNQVRDRFPAVSDVLVHVEPAGQRREAGGPAANERLPASET